MSVCVYACVCVCLYMCVCVCACVWVGYVLYDYNGSNTTKTMLTIGGLFDCLHTHILYIHTHTLCLHTGICVLTKQCTTMFHMSRGQGGGPVDVIMGVLRTMAAILSLCLSFTS